MRIGFRILGIARRIEHELLPRRCAFCGLPLRGSRGRMCAGCKGDLVRNEPACRACALPVTTGTPTLCRACEKSRRPFTAAVVPLAYTYPLDAAIKALKFHRRLHYVPAFAEILCAAASDLPGGIDAIQPVPLHRWRKLRRGFNQARELALPVARELSLPLLDCVRRRRHTPYQSGLSAAERRRNLRDAFVLRRPVFARHVLLVDDVMTTGSTCRQIGALLTQHGVEEVSVLALARALPP